MMHQYTVMCSLTDTPLRYCECVDSHAGMMVGEDEYLIIGRQAVIQGLDNALLELRMVRDRLLSESDWTQLSDSPLSSDKQQEWSIYRRRLRDMMGLIVSMSDIESITFPNHPV